MSNDVVADLFSGRSHNPSFFAVKERAAYKGRLLDFCIPVNLHFPPPELFRMIRDNLAEILRYYPDYAVVHQEHIAGMIGVDPETIVPANGSTEIITMLCQQAAGPIVTSVPTFSRWTDLPEELSVPLHTILRKRENGFRLGVGEIVTHVKETSAQILVISNPNNPTGAWLTLKDVETLADSLRNLDTVIIDESFIDFSDLESAVSLVTNIDNLVIVKSMGKSIGWHGVRLGYAVTQSRRARAMRGQLPLWNINGLAAYVLKNVGRFKRQYRESFARVAEDRQYMGVQLSMLPELTVYPSKANFLFVELPEWVPGRALRDSLLRNHGLMIRECSNKVGSSEQYVRLAVQAKDPVDILVVALQVELERFKCQRGQVSRTELSVRS